MRRCLAALLLVLAPASAAPPPTQYGPRVTLEGQLPLSQALRQIGRQINRYFLGAALNQPETATKVHDWHLSEATVAATLDAVQQATGCRLQRSGRNYYALDPAGGPGAIGQPLGDYRVWLPRMRLYFSSYLGLLRGSRAYTYLQVMPQLVVEAPSDPEALRIVEIGNATTLLPDGQASPPSPTVQQHPDPSDPRCWLLSPSLYLRDAPAAELQRLSFDVTFAAQLDELRFDFTLGADRAQLLTDGDFDATLAAAAGTAATPPSAITASLTGPRPPAAKSQPEDPHLALARQLWVEGRFFDDADQPLLTFVRLESVTPADALWTSRWRFEVPGSRGRVPARLELRVYVRGGAGVKETVVFDHVPLPDLFGTP